MLVVFFETVNRGVRVRRSRTVSQRAIAECAAPLRPAACASPARSPGALAIAVRLPPCEKFVVSPATRALP
jgi:hypothetical protein